MTERALIRKRYKELFKPRCCPYMIYDWWKVFTPIESYVWGDIRSLGIPFYPQYPVNQYLIDFADPVEKIGIEVDGFKYHHKEEDLKKDDARQKDLESWGWTIYRIRGYETIKELADFFNEKYDDEVDGVEPDYAKHLQMVTEADYYDESSEGILRIIKSKHYN